MNCWVDGDFESINLHKLDKKQFDNAIINLTNLMNKNGECVKIQAFKEFNSLHIEGYLYVKNGWFAIEDFFGIVNKIVPDADIHGFSFTYTN